MNNLNKKELMNVIDKSAEDLHQKIDRHHYLMSAILEKKVNDTTLRRLSLPSFLSDESKFKEALKETIRVLEETRKAFKSKRLETLRKKLTQLLIGVE